MNRVLADPSSYRDVAGTVYRSGDRILRTVNAPAVADYEFVRTSGLLDELTTRGHVVAAQEVDRAEGGEFAADAAYLLEHPRLPFISYPYEWCFEALKAAALHHLDIQLEALERGVALSDASAYNAQFVGTRPVFIDTLSFRRYRDGEFWTGHRQFCEQFLNPLLLHALCGVPHNAWYRGSLEGIASLDLRRVLPLRALASRNVLTHVVLQALLGAAAASAGEAPDIKGQRLPLAAFRHMLQRLRDRIAGMLPARRRATTWQAYEAFKSYESDETAHKAAFVGRFTAAVKPAMVWDIGCNTGTFALAALGGGAGRVIGWDADQGALDAAFQRAREADAAFTPLYGGAVNPAPAQGWAQAERQGWAERGPADAVLALALVHHLAIGRDVPLPHVVDWLVTTAPNGVVEFVGKEDVQVRRMLALREDIFADYDLETFVTLLQERACITERVRLEPGGRELIWFSQDRAA